PAYDATPEQRIAAVNAPPSSAVTSTAVVKRGGAALLAGPKISLDEQGLSSDWVRLERTRTLVAAIAKATRNAGLLPRILLDADACEDKVYSMRRPLAVLFATHGQFLRSLSFHLQYSISIGSNKPGTANEDFFDAADPLQRSMLILAGANQRNHSVVLY